MRTNFGRMIAFAIVAALALPAGAIAQSGVGAAPAQSTMSSAPPTQAQVTQPQEGDVNWKGVGVGAGTVLANVGYIPAKLVYGILGGIGGGAGYLLTGGNEQVSNTIWRSSLGGDYVLTPDMMTGQKPVHFSGPTTTAPAPQDDPGTAAITGATTGAPLASRTGAMPPGVGTAPASSGYSSSTAAMAPTHPMDSGTGPITSGSSLSGSSINSSPIGGSGPISGGHSTGTYNSAGTYNSGGYSSTGRYSSISGGSAKSGKSATSSSKALSTLPDTSIE
jgi:hypothetical protein